MLRFRRALRHAIPLAALLGASLAGLLAPRPAHATPTAYQGIYVIIDPYNSGQIADLKAAARTSCTQSNQHTSPFCGATNGILLRVPWCDFQLYHLTNSAGQPYSSCHYSTAFSGLTGNAGEQVPIGDIVSPCSGPYDTCTGHAGSILAASLADIVQINNQRALAKLKPLQLSVGMFAGLGTPQTVLDTIGYEDVVNTTDPNLAPSSFQCLRLPLSWRPQYITDYEQSFDQMIAFIKAQFPQGPNIVLVKAAGINASDLEVQMPGAATFYAGPSDPGPAGPGPALSCSTSLNGAQVWYNAYYQQPNEGENFSQANETAFASIIGHEWATIQNDGLTGATLSLATTNSSAFADVDCGASAAGACVAGTPADGPYTIFYFDRYIADLFNGGLAYTTARSAFAAASHASFALSPDQIAVDSTALNSSPYASITQTPCNLNNTKTADQATFMLDGKTVDFVGPGSVISFQTSPNEGANCKAGGYLSALNVGINDGALFLEVETDAAFADLSTCLSPLTTAFDDIMKLNPPTVCTYPTG